MNLLNLTTREELKAALTMRDDTMSRITRKLDRVGWARLEATERSFYLHGLRMDVRRGGGRLVRIAGVPAVWTVQDDALHGGCRFPSW